MLSHRALYRATFATFSLLCLAASPAAADDDDLGAYLFKGDCGSFAANLVVDDIGDLDIEQHAAKEWARVSPDGASAPAQLWAEDESSHKVTEADLAAGGWAVAVTEDDNPGSRLIACGDIPAGISLPHVSDLHEVADSGISGRVAIEPHKKGVKFTTVAYASGAVPPLGQ